MKTIQPIQIWKNGASFEASVLDARIINDDLKSSCTFYYYLKKADTVIPSEVEGEPDKVINGEILVDGNVIISGEDYINWDGSNDFAFEYIANDLNLVLVIED